LAPLLEDVRDPSCVASDLVNLLSRRCREIVVSDHHAHNGPPSSRCGCVCAGMSACLRPRHASETCKGDMHPSLRDMQGRHAPFPATRIHVQQYHMSYKWGELLTPPLVGHELARRDLSAPALRVCTKSSSGVCKKRWLAGPRGGALLESLCTCTGMKQKRGFNSNLNVSRERKGTERMFGRPISESDRTFILRSYAVFSLDVSIFTFG